MLLIRKNRMSARNGLDLRWSLIFLLMSGNLAAETADDTGASQRAGMTILPTVALSGTWTDNITLTEVNPESEFVTAIIPGVSLTDRTRRFSAVADYRMEGLFYARDSSRNELYHKLEAAAQSELVEQWLYLDGDAFYTQHSITPDGRVGYDNIPVTDNRSDVWSLALSPYMRHEFGRDLAVRAGANFRKVAFKKGGLQDRTQEQWFLDVGNNPSAGQDLTWKVTYRRNEVKREILSDSTFERALLDLRYAPTIKYQFYAQGGREKNRFEVAPGVKAPEGSLWFLGAVWRPGAFTMVDVAFGRRYFGNSRRLEIFHRGAHFGFSAKYAEELTTVTQLLTRLDTERVQGSLQALGGEETGDVLSLSDYVLPSFSVTTYLGKRLEGTLFYEGAKTSLSLRLYDARREFQKDASKDEFTGYVLKATRRIRPYTNAELRLDVASRSASTGLDSRFRRASLMARHRFMKNVDSSLGYIYEKRSGAATTDYSMNMVFVSAVVAF